MTDRELLQDAAKAAGHKIVEWTKDGNSVEVAIIVRGDGDGFSKRPWQPLHENQLTDTDGDALRLANSLQMNVDFCCYRVVRGARIDVIEDAEHGLPAIRRAIVRAAAEIGKGMK